MSAFSLEELNSREVNTAGLDVATKTIERLYSKYADDTQIFAKMHNYICFRLPALIEEMKRTGDERRLRNEYLSTEQDSFICSFLNDNQYYYCPQTELYFHYNGRHYATKREDDVLHHILTSITKECNALIPRKPQTKVYIMKRIKEMNPLKSIPESATIQSVLDSLCPAIFSTKPAAKYFLTVLGDNLLKKTDETTHAYFTTPKAKEFLREVAAISQSLFGVSATATFKYKYHSHAFKTIRLVQMNNTAGVEPIWRPILQLRAIDLLCVAAHYSGRYESADQYLEMYSNDADLVKYATHFRWKIAKDVVAEFAAEYFRTSEDAENKITESTMEYLWRKYLKEHKFPAVLGSQGFLSTAIEYFPGKHDKDSACFRGLVSSHSVVIDQFQKFWKECIVVDKTDPLAEYEVDELVMLYRHWSFDLTGNPTIAPLTESQMLELIRFYQDVDVIDNKFAQGIKSSLWDKQHDLRVFFSEFCKVTELDEVSFYDAYLAYRAFCKSPASPENKNATLSFSYTHASLQNCPDEPSRCGISHSRVISKKYFEMYIYDAFGNENITNGKIRLGL
jgi:hypothetical protein